MKKQPRTLQQIEESLRRKLAEAESDDTMGYMGDIGKASPHKGDPVLDPGLGTGMGRQGAGRSSSKPRYKLDPSTGKPVLVKPGKVPVGTNKPGGPKVWRKGEAEPFPSIAKLPLMVIDPPASTIILAVPAKVPPPFNVKLPPDKT